MKMTEEGKASGHELPVFIFIILTMALVAGLSQYVHEQTGLSTALIPPVAGVMLAIALLLWIRKKNRLPSP